MKQFSAFCAFTFPLLATLSLAQGDGYYGYHLNRRGDDESAIYETEGTTSGVAPLDEQPDVYLNASVSVGEISVEVQNLTAKINLDAQVLSLLNFNAGVDASIDRVKLGIYDVKAKVELEARLGNVLRMVTNVLESIDLNPLIVTLGNTVSDVVDDVGDVLDGSSTSSSTTTTTGEDSSSSSSTIAKRDFLFQLEHNILYSIDNFTGAKHRNRVLEQDGTLVDIYLNNKGLEKKRKQVGFYKQAMKFTGHNRTVYEDEEKLFELQYLYEPYRGLRAYCNIYANPAGQVLRTKVVAEAEGGGSATISGSEEI